MIMVGGRDAFRGGARTPAHAWGPGLPGSVPGGPGAPGKDRRRSGIQTSAAAPGHGPVPGSARRLDMRS